MDRLVKVHVELIEVLGEIDFCLCAQHMQESLHIYLFVDYIERTHFMDQSHLSVHFGDLDRRSRLK